jgi:hypothetical protein
MICKVLSLITLLVIASLADAQDVVTPTGTFTQQFRPSLSSQTVVDARNAHFVASESNNIPVYIEGGSAFLGGVIAGTYDPAQTWSYYSNQGGAGIYLRPAQQTPFLVDGMRLDNNHDGIRLRENVQNFTIRNVYMTNIHDDCVENDFYFSGVVENSLLDGCYVAFSAREGSVEAIGGPNELWEIRNNLVRKQAFNGPYFGPSPGHGPTFKLNQTTEQGLAPRLALHDNIFRIDQEASHGAHLFPPEARIASCSNNILVWLGVGSFPGDLKTDPTTGQPCFTITTDISVWENARSNWLAAHGYQESPSPDITVTISPNKLDFTAVQGSQPAAKILLVSASPSNVQWSSNTSATWLTLSSVTGVTPVSVNVIANTSGLGVGNHLANIVISAAGATNSPLSIPVSLALSAPPPPPNSGPAITSPTPGSTLSSSVTFTWSTNGAKVKKWELWVGTTQGGSNIHNIKLSGTSRAVTGIPAGQTIWVRLRFDIGGTWQFRDFQYAS